MSCEIAGPLEPNEEQSFRFEVIEEVPIFSDLGGFDYSLTPERLDQLQDDALDLLRRPDNRSVDLYKGIIAGLCVQTGTIAEDQIPELLGHLSSVYSGWFKSDISHTPDGAVTGVVMDTLDELAEKENPIALILEGIVTKSGNSREATYLLRYFLATIAGARSVLPEPKS